MSGGVSSSGDVRSAHHLDSKNSKPHLGLLSVANMGRIPSFRTSPHKASSSAHTFRAWR